MPGARSRPTRRRTALAVGAACLVVLIGAVAVAATGLPRDGAPSRATATGSPSPTRAAAQPLPAAPPVPAGATRIVAVGDIACASTDRVTPTTCQQPATAALTTSLAPTAVLALGDLQYPAGALADVTRSYAASWGPLRSITRPLPGNHEYRTTGAAGYFSYFGGRPPFSQGYDAFDLGGWRVYTLDSNCDRIACPAERDWLRADLAANPRACTIVAMHHPRFSSGGEHGSNASVKLFWDVAYAAGVDVVLAGHDHDYERFVRLNPLGVPDGRGPISFVSGAGGKSLYPMGTVVKGSAFRDASTPGVLRLDLRDGAFDYAFHTVGGQVKDAGSRPCV